VASLTFPDEFNLADYFLYARLDEGLGDKNAILFGSSSYTYAEVAERSKALARRLGELGICREQRAYLVLKDTPAFAWSFFGVLTHGAVVAMGNPASKADDLNYVLGYSRATLLVTEPLVADALSQEILANPYLKAVLLVPDAGTGEDCEADIEIPAGLQGASIVVETLAQAVGRGRELADTKQPAIRRDDTAIWLFTSGSTGRPKAAVHTHRDFAFNTEVYAKGTVGYERDDITVSVPRLFFGYATGTNLMFPFAVGATTGLFSERPTPESLSDAIEQYKPTIVTNVPTMMGKLLNHDEMLQSKGRPGLDFSTVRFHLSAGEALPPALLDRFTKRFGGNVYDGIGSAEMFHIYASNRPGDVMAGSLGRVVQGYEIKILAEDATGPGAPALMPGQTGVMWVKGDSVAQCYFQDRDKSWGTFHGHWCRTGDLFRIDEEGYLWFSGRADSLLKVSGQWVAPLEVEQCITSHPLVSNAAVIGAQADGLMRIKAFVVTREAWDGENPDELRESIRSHVKSHLAPHKYPRWVCLVQDLPKNDRGKIDRKMLTEREAEGTNPWE
jgi:benzoate-CoA ligase family protein